MQRVWLLPTEMNMRGLLSGCAIAAGLMLANQAFAGNLSGIGDASTADQSSVVGLGNEEGYNTFGQNRYSMPNSEYGALNGGFGAPYYSGRSVYRETAPQSYLPY